ncbi:AAA family ATPase [Sphingomonas sp. Leaf37]|uniref:AAA family ATPase n=1 Tax=Sphingomonas sp. Leaf37 TaxID=2876552 RepID=UPI001E5CB29F|nr:AAA family ATPase [Sphingomonas sp. Leaf37]
MMTRLAIAGYRSIRDMTVDLAPLTIVTGPNGSGKSSLYRSLRLLSDVAQGRLIASLAQEGGLSSVLWAGPEKISADMRSGRVPVQGTRRSDPIALKLGFSGADFGYAVDLGLPVPGSGFANDPEIKVEAMWNGELLGRANLFAERRGPLVTLRTSETGEWRRSPVDLSSFDTMVTHAADPRDGLELLLMRERMRNWRFYDALRTDQTAPARRPQVTTYTPVLASDGSDLTAAIATIHAIGDGAALDNAVDDAFAGSSIAFTASGPNHVTIGMRQPGMLRPLGASELSDGTLRYLLLVAALLSPRPPELMVLNEPEANLHPSLLPALARLLLASANTCQIIVVSHSGALIDALGASEQARSIALAKDMGETRVSGQRFGPDWRWPKR